MFEKEEKELDTLSHYYNHITIPRDFGNEAIMKGIKQANKLRKRKRQITISFISAASILLLSLLASVRVSETMAAYMLNVPGMEKIVDLIRNDKGLLATVENDYIQNIGVTESHDGVKVTLDSVIHDEKHLLAFFKYETEDKNLDIIPNIKLKMNDGTELPSEHGLIWSKNKDSMFEARFSLPSGTSISKNLSLAFTFQGLGSNKTLGSEWNIPFNLDKEKFAEKKMIKLNKTVGIQGQKITIDKVLIYPSQTEVYVTYNSNNSKKIFGFNDLQLVDEKGSSWDFNGIQAKELSENKSIFYLESNYFNNPEKLYLSFKTLRALEKDQLWVEIDPKNKKILKAPKDGKISDVEKVIVGEEALSIKLKENFNEFTENIFNTVENSSGQVISRLSSKGVSPSDHFIHFSMSYPKTPGIIRFKLTDYPNTIQSDSEVRIKLK